MIERINELLNSKIDFAFETTLTTLSFVQTIKVAKENGYKINLIYFWLNDVKLALERVRIRVSEGGHNIPEETIRRRYFKGIYNLTKKFINVCDYWIVIDNSEKPSKFIVKGNNKKESEIYHSLIWEQIKNQSNEKK